MTPGNIASTVAQAGGSTPENAELPPTMPLLTRNSPPLGAALRKLLDPEIECDPRTGRQCPYSQCVQFTLRATQPVPVWTAAVDAKTHQHHPPITQRALRKSFDMLNWHTEFRGVGFDRLPTILATGVDVEPATAPIFVSDFDKAWEYGGLAKGSDGFQWNAPRAHIP